MPEPFDPQDVVKMLLWCDRHCCMCDQPCGASITVHHIDPAAGKEFDNGIPVCKDCHRKMERRDPGGRPYRPEEIKARREQIYDKYTRYLVPPVKHEVTQVVGRGSQSRRRLPNVGFNLEHSGDYFLPVKIKVEAKVFLDGKDLGFVSHRHGYYDGTARWHLNPQFSICGDFSIPDVCATNPHDLKIEVRVSIFDEYGREHRQLPIAWSFNSKTQDWFLEPRTFTEWK